MIQRLEPVIIELEREKESVVVIAHQAILRALYGYYSCTPLTDIPTLEIPLHTVIELTPKADGTMTEERFETGVPTTKQVGDWHLLHPGRGTPYGYRAYLIIAA